MHLKTFIPCVIFVSVCCNNNSLSSTTKEPLAQNVAETHGDENLYPDIKTIPLPAGFSRMTYSAPSFSSWLRQVRLKKDKIVYTFDGREKLNQSAQFAVLDISVGNKDLQQCADAVMRLRAEYLFAIKEFGAIKFTDNDGRAYLFNPPYNRTNFKNYLDKVYSRCGSASLSKQLGSKSFDSIAAGDVIIRGGFPGHAVIVMDVAINKAGKRIYLLAQSYMPAQDIHVLVNPTNKDLSPWYEADGVEILETPEYNFTNKELKSW